MHQNIECCPVQQGALPRTRLYLKTDLGSIVRFLGSFLQICFKVMPNWILPTCVCISGSNIQYYPHSDAFRYQFSFLFITIMWCSLQTGWHRGCKMENIFKLIQRVIFSSTASAMSSWTEQCCCGHLTGRTAVELSLARYNYWRIAWKAKQSHGSHCLHALEHWFSKSTAVFHSHFKSSSSE